MKELVVPDQRCSHLDILKLTDAGMKWELGERGFDMWGVFASLRVSCVHTHSEN